MVWVQKICGIAIFVKGFKRYNRFIDNWLITNCFAVLHFLKGLKWHKRFSLFMYFSQEQSIGIALIDASLHPTVAENAPYVILSSPRMDRNLESSGLLFWVNIFKRMVFTCG
jgi:hypothetical protein